MGRLIFLFGALFWSGLSLLAQEAEAQADTMPQPLLREWVTLMYDKEQGCYQGDTIHFMAYVEREGKEGATDYSRVLYVELLNPMGDVVVRKKLRLSEGRTRGEIWVDSLYGSGFYELRAYTRYMTNWSDYQYFSRVVPVFVPNSKLSKPMKENERCIYTLTPRMTTHGSFFERQYQTFRDTIYELKQPMERNLMVFGSIMPKFKKPTADDLRLGERKMKVAIQQGKKVLAGEVETDSLGRYALYFPDVEGEWNMRIFSERGRTGNRENLNRHTVTVNGLFAPDARRYLPQEVEPAQYGVKKWKEDRSQETWLSRFFDCDAASYDLKNAGFVSLGFYDYLGKVDRRFSRTTGVASPTILNVARDTTYNKYWDINLFGKDSNDPHTVCVDGPSFSGRPVIWIVDGAYRLVTGLNKQITDFEVLRPTKASMPIYMDEARSVYLTQNPEAYRPYIRCSVLEKKKPFTVFITTHRHYIWDDSTLFSASFDGFSEEKGE